MLSLPKKLLFIFCCQLFIFNCLVLAQNPPMKIGDVDEKDVMMKIYEPDKEAEAVVLCDYGNFYYNLRGMGDSQYFVTILEMRRRIKILKKEGLARANIVLNYRADKIEEISSIKAFCYNYENGKVQKIKLEKSAIFEKKINSDFYEVKFTIPNVKEGSVIEYSYEKTSKYEGYIPTWYFQENIPVVWSEFRTSIPQYYDFVKIYNATKFDIKTVSQENSNIGEIKYINENSRWVQKNLRAFKNEAFIASVSDHLVKIEFQLAGTQFPNSPYKPHLLSWEGLIDKLLEHENHGKYLDHRRTVREKVATLIQSLTTEKEKMTAIYEYVKTNFKNNEVDMIYTDLSFKDVWNKKIGGSAEINLLLVTMLREAGLQANPLLLSTRQHGKINMGYPILSKFNYNLCYVEIDNKKENFLLDATDPMLSLGMVSFEALNGVGLIIEKSKQPQWIAIQKMKAAKSSSITLIDANIDAEGKVEGKTKGRFTGYIALGRRATHKKNQKENKDDKNQRIFNNMDEFNKPLEETSVFQTKEHCQVNGDVLYLTPMLEHKMKENVFKQEDRMYPVDFSVAIEEAYYINYTIPDGYKVDELPKPFRVKWHDESVKYEFIIEQKENKIKIVNKFYVNKAIFEPEEYADLRKFFASIVAKHEEVIVIKKK